MTDTLKDCEYHAETVPGVRLVEVQDPDGIDSGSQVFCDLCGAAGPIKHDEDDAIAAWNTRAAERVPEEVVESQAKDGITMHHARSSEVAAKMAAARRYARRETIRAIYGPKGVEQLEAQPHD